MDHRPARWWGPHPERRVKVVAGDIGGTHARLAVVEVAADRVTILTEAEYPSRDYPGLAPIVREFIAGMSQVPRRACFGVPCPVTDGVCVLANLNWTLELESFRRESGLADAWLINDFAALARAIPLLEPRDLLQVKPGTPVERAPIAILGAGTGLGQGALLWQDGRYQVAASEGGHVDFAPRTPEEIRLLEHLLVRFGRVSYERVVSGPGLSNIYRFLAETGFAREQPAVRAAMEKQDPAAVISTHGLTGDDPLCVRTLDIFASVYGAQAGNLALIYRAQAGVYLAGGVAPRVAGKLVDGSFTAAFGAKGRLSPMLVPIPVSIIIHPAPGLLGAAAAAADPSLFGA